MSNSLPVALLSPCSTWSDLKALLALPSYATILTALSSVYFITAGLQFWSTAFLITVLGESPGQAFIYIGATLATSPILGVVFGGWLVSDVMGGYRGRQRATALRICAYLTGISTVVGLLMPVLKETRQVVLCLWAVMFLSSAVLPVSVSVSVNVSAHVRIAYKISKIYEQVGHPPCGFVCNIQYQALSGLLVSTVPIELRESSATASALVFNALGR